MTADPHAPAKLSLYRETLLWVQSRALTPAFQRWMEWAECRIPMLEEEVAQS